MAGRARRRAHRARGTNLGSLRASARRRCTAVAGQLRRPDAAPPSLRLPSDLAARHQVGDQDPARIRYGALALLPRQPHAGARPGRGGSAPAPRRGRAATRLPHPARAPGRGRYRLRRHAAPLHFGAGRLHHLDLEPARGLQHGGSGLTRCAAAAHRAAPGTRCELRDLRGLARDLSRPQRRLARARRQGPARRGQAHPRGDPGLRPARLHRALRGSAQASWWEARIVSGQQDVMIAAAATAVGINMTFLLPYSMLRKGWGRGHRGLATFDLGTGLLIPFALATGCVVVAAASQFHARYDEALVSDPAAAAGSSAYLSTLDARLKQDFTDDAAAYEAVSIRPALKSDLGEGPFVDRVAQILPTIDLVDRKLAAMLLKRDAFHLAGALEPLTGGRVAHLVFGIGVLGMALSTIIVLMLISGFAFCEAFGAQPRGTAHRAGAMVAGLIGALGPFVWKGEAKFYLAVPTSNFGMALLPIAYWTFFLMMNSRSLLGDDLPKGAKRVVWNASMLVAAGIATFASVTTIEKNLGAKGMWAMGAFLGLALIVHLRRRARPDQNDSRNPM